MKSSQWSAVSGQWFRNFALMFLNSAFFLFCFVFPIKAQNKPCEFNSQTLQFAGTPVEQARCLLRPNKIGGVLGDELKSLPKPLGKLIGQRVEIKKENLRKYLLANKFDENTLGGSLDDRLSKAKLPNGEEIAALYFIIHDASYPYLADAPFPENFNTDKNWNGNKLEIWLKQPVAHIFVNRLGESLTTTPFAETVEKGWGTKFARDILKVDAKGLQLHIELIQPRRRDVKNPNPENDLIAPFPGFTDEQYAKLALLYVCASLRRGTWLIPAYHSAIDAGIKDAHDDPQNFELEKFAKKLKKLIKSVK
ncbi:MAG TPA: hypothetical protein VGC76_01875 [Pyrinomonadaceae bacterium]|jgi:hypothetical protein